jgi:hypothetical protein
MRHTILIGMGLLMALGAFTFLSAAPRTVVCEVLYQET